MDLYRVIWVDHEYPEDSLDLGVRPTLSTAQELAQESINQWRTEGELPEEAIQWEELSNGDFLGTATPPPHMGTNAWFELAAVEL